MATPDEPTEPPLSACRLAGLGYLTVAGCAAVVLGLGVWIAVGGNPYARGKDMDVLFTVQKALRGAPLYTDPADLPFDIARHPPLFYLLCLAVTRSLDVSADDPMAVVRACRAVSLAAAVLTVGMVFAAGRGLGLRSGSAAAAAGFGFVAVSPWHFAARPDAVACLLTFAAFAAAVRAADPGARRPVWLAVVAVVLGGGAAFAEPAGAQAVGVVLAYLALARRWRPLTAAVVTAAGVAAAAVLALSAWPHLTANVAAGADTGVSLQNAFDQTYRAFFSNFAPVLGACLFPLARWARPGRDHRQAFFVVALPVLFLVATAAGLRAGSSEEVYSEFLYAAALALARFLDAPGPWAAAARGLGAAYLVAFLPFWTVSQVRVDWWGLVNPDVSLAEPVNSYRSAELRRLADHLRGELADDPDAKVLAFERAVPVLLQDRCVVPHGVLAARLRDRRRVDYEGFRRAVAAGRVRLIVTHHEDVPPETFLGADLRRFVRADRVGTFNVYRYQPVGP